MLRPLVLLVFGLGQLSGRRARGAQLAVTIFGVARRLASLVSDDKLVAASLKASGELLIRIGYATRAHDYLTRSLRLFEQVGSQADVAATLHQLAVAATNQGNAHEAVDSARRAIDIQRRLGDTDSEAVTLSD